ncbi:LysE family translocator [Roseospira visakhapatnamensis]|uniref:Threonine/homoserine/homoserine lactone efflux protein n=1 Tax=Roseospira visakhapatnamensis TaxID=390880 RepID=A0A7W6RB16_9PROT|nr:LysE family translocator [Roseospira visakhapatnamensis]MBB4264841.1 threonine/homoserine/homoserine lactone efflux protein [Roseospira visakhapatnamensis]
MDLPPLIKGTLIGFAIAAPVGPVGILCIRRALADGRMAAFVAGLGAAVADTLYGAVAAWGLTLVTNFLTNHRTLLSVVGGVFLVYLGVRTMRARSQMLPTPDTHIGLMRDFLSTFLITLTNPATILAFMAVFASITAVQMRSPVSLDTNLLILGVFIGSAAWWGLLSAVAGAVRSHFTPMWLRWLNRGSGAVLVLFGVGVLVSAVV